MNNQKSAFKKQNFDKNRKSLTFKPKFWPFLSLKTEILTWITKSQHLKSKILTKTEKVWLLNQSFDHFYTYKLKFFTWITENQHFELKNQKFSQILDIQIHS